MMKSPRLLMLARILAILAVVALSIFIFSIRREARALAIYGYPGVFLLAMLANATVLLPAPGVMFVFAMGSVLNPIGVALAAGAGAALGELSGYLAGFSGQGVAERADLYNKVLAWMTANRRLTYLLIVVMAAIPNPFFDIAGIAAGALKIPIHQFVFFTWIGSTIKMTLFAFAGSSAVHWFWRP
jgi:membrane protein YqaA with SNARE-associated domain